MLFRAGFRSFVHLPALAATSAVVAACSSSSSGGNSAPTCPPDNPDCAALATAEKGQEQVMISMCQQCHTPNMAGTTVPITKDRMGNPLPSNVMLYPPNLTNDPTTGLGNWTDDQIARAIRNGIDDQNEKLCPQMNHFADFNDFQVYSVVKYLRSLPPVNQKIPTSVCPPLKN